MKSRHIMRVFSLLLALLAPVEILPLPALAAERSTAAAHAAEYCWFCKGTYSYTPKYVQWSDTIHSVEHICSNCGRDQANGADAENHDFVHYNSTYDQCSKCGYFTDCTHITVVCFHFSTRKTWEGCKWYLYCLECGELVDSGADHTAILYESWRYVSDSEHRRYGSCTECGEGSYQYEEHSASRRYTSYDETQHRAGTYCSVCSAYTSNLTYEDHWFDYGEWVSCSASLHRRTKTCYDCGYSTYDYKNHVLTDTLTAFSETEHTRERTCFCGYSEEAREAHTFSYGRWASVGSQHRRTKTCSCGYSSYEYGNHLDADGNGECDSCGYLLARFSVTVPSSLTLAVSEQGQVYAAGDAAITNSSTGDVKVTGITVRAQGKRTLVPYNCNMADTKVDSRLIGFSVNGAASTKTGSSEGLTLSEGWTIRKGDALPLKYGAVVSATSTAIRTEEVLSLVFVIAWADA